MQAEARDAVCSGCSLTTCVCCPVLLLQNIRPEARTYNAIISTCNGAGRYSEVRIEHVFEWLRALCEVAPTASSLSLPAVGRI